MPQPYHQGGGEGSGAGLPGAHPGCAPAIGGADPGSVPGEGDFGGAPAAPLSAGCGPVASFITAASPGHPMEAIVLAPRGLFFDGVDAHEDEFLVKINAETYIRFRRMPSTPR